MTFSELIKRLAHNMRIVTRSASKLESPMDSWIERAIEYLKFRFWIELSKLSAKGSLLPSAPTFKKEASYLQITKIGKTEPYD